MQKYIIGSVKIIMAVLAVVCMIVESQFNYPKIHEYLADPFALALSILLPVFTSFAFEASAILRKQKVRVVWVGLIIAATFSMVFSITMIVRGQYDKQIAKTNLTIETRSTEKSDNSLYELKQGQLKDKENIISSTQAEIARLDKILAQDKNDTNAYWARYRANEDMKKYQDEKEKIIFDMQELLTDGNIAHEVKEERTFDQWFAELIRWKPEAVTMLLYLILPVFITIIAPLGIYFSLGLYENTEEKKQRKPRKPRSQNLKPFIETWVQYNWMSLKNGYEKILPKATFLEFMKNKGIEFPSDIFDKIYKLSEITGCTKEGKIIEENDAESIKKMLTNIGK